MKSLLRSAAHWLYPRGSIRRVLRGSRKGCRFVVRDAMGVMFALGKPDEDLLNAYRAQITPGALVFDLGANRGQMSLFLSRLVGAAGQVVAFEPVPAVAADLERNCQLNSMTNVTVICAAAAGSNGEQVFLFPKERQTQGKLADVEPTYNNAGEDSLRVRTVTLDSVVADLGRAPRFIKIDVEGAAGSVLSGASSLLREGRPIILMELHGPEEQKAARDLIVNYGYTVTTLDGEVVTDPTAEWNSPLLCRPAGATV